MNIFYPVHIVICLVERVKFYNRIGMKKNQAIAERDKNNNKSNSQFIYEKLKQVDQIKVNEQAAKLLLEDPTIYDYDGCYDQIKAKKQKAVEQRRQQQQIRKGESKYISNIKKTFQKRQRQHEIIQQRIQSKKVKKQLSGEEQVFITSNYLKQKENKKLLEQQQKAEEQYNKLHSVDNKNKNVGDFTAELLKQDLEGYRPDINSIKLQPKAKFYSESKRK